jgi:hypothetical protein
MAAKRGLRVDVFESKLLVEPLAEVLILMDLSQYDFFLFGISK